MGIVLDCLVLFRLFRIIKNNKTRSEYLLTIKGHILQRCPVQDEEEGEGRREDKEDEEVEEDR